MLVDGEHYPEVVAATVAHLVLDGYAVVGGALLGGTEKLRLDAPAPDFGVPDLVGGDGPLDALRRALERFTPDVVVDLSDEPVVDARLRMLLAAVTLRSGASYRGADFVFEPPPRPRLARKPSMAVIGTGKRTGKTAVAGHLARTLSAAGRRPVIVAMGRGGPEEPEVLDPSQLALTPEALLAWSDAGRHAASDHVEDALMAGVVTVGTRRCGGGLAGAPVDATFGAGVAVANERPEELLILEGSGAAIPPCHADVTVLVVPAHADPELVTGHLGAYRVLLADLVVVTLGHESHATPGAFAAVEDRIRGLVPGTPLVHTLFRPHPLEPISGCSVFFATTAPEAVAPHLVAHLEATYGARVVGRSSHLANRTKLLEDLEAAGSAEVLVTELKAAAVDVATRVALERGMRVTYCDNRPVTTGGDGSLDELALVMAERAARRFAEAPPDARRPGTRSQERTRSQEP